MFAGRPGVTFRFPNKNKTIDYVRYRGFFPTLKDGTICAWLESNNYDVKDFSTLASYSTGEAHNELAIGFRNLEVFTVSWGNEICGFHLPILSAKPAKVGYNLCRVIC